MTTRERIIQNYIDAYNCFDVDKMVADFDTNIVFENINNGETTLSLMELAAFRQQAEQAKTYFTARTQTIKTLVHDDNTTEVEIAYKAILAIELPKGLKKGQELNLSGKSTFVFADDKIIKLVDVI